MVTHQYNFIGDPYLLGRAYSSAAGVVQNMPNKQGHRVDPCLLERAYSVASIGVTEYAQHARAQRGPLFAQEGIFFSSRSGTEYDQQARAQSGPLLAWEGIFCSKQGWYRVRGAGARMVTTSRLRGNFICTTEGTRN